MLQVFIKETLYKITPLLLVLLILSACANKVQKPEVVVNIIDTAKPVITKAHQAEYDNALDLMKAKSYDDALSIFIDLTNVYPKLAGAYVNLALIYRAKSDDTKADLSINKALEINPNNVDALIQMAASSQKNGAFKDVQKYLLTAEAIDSTNDVVQYNLAVLYELYLQQYDDAIDHYEHYVALTSNDDKETVKRWIKLLEKK